MSGVRLEIDKHKLDEECLQQAEPVRDVGELFAKAKFEADTALSKLKLVKAKLEFEIRNSPDEFGLPKVTESLVDAAVLTQPETIKADAAYNRAVYEMGLVEAVKDGLMDRKKMLALLVELHSTNYYQSISEMPRGVRGHNRHQNGD